MDAEARRSAADVYGEDRLRCCEAQARQRWNLDIHLQDTGHQGGRRTCVEYCRGDFQYLAASQVLNLRPSLGKLDWKRPRYGYAIDFGRVGLTAAGGEYLEDRSLRSGFIAVGSPVLIQGSEQARECLRHWQGIGIRAMN